MLDSDDTPAADGNGRKPGGRDREPAALALAAGRTVRDAAAAAAVSERSVRYWLAEADGRFAARVRELRAELYTAAVGKLAELSGRAADVLGGLLNSESELVRRQTAVNVLELGTRLREAADIADELAALRRDLTGDGEDGSSGTPPGVERAAGDRPGPSAVGEGDPGAAPQ